MAFVTNTNINDLFCFRRSILASIYGGLLGSTRWFGGKHGKLLGQFSPLVPAPSLLVAVRCHLPLQWCVAWAATTWILASQASRSWGFPRAEETGFKALRFWFTQSSKSRADPNRLAFLLFHHCWLLWGLWHHPSCSSNVAVSNATHQAMHAILQTNLSCGIIQSFF